MISLLLAASASERFFIGREPGDRSQSQRRTSSIIDIISW